MVVVEIPIGEVALLAVYFLKYLTDFFRGASQQPLTVIALLDKAGVGIPDGELPHLVLQLRLVSKPRDLLHIAVQCLELAFYIPHLGGYETTITLLAGHGGGRTSVDVEYIWYPKIFPGVKHAAEQEDGILSRHQIFLKADIVPVKEVFSEELIPDGAVELATSPLFHSINFILREQHRFFRGRHIVEDDGAEFVSSPDVLLIPLRYQAARGMYHLCAIFLCGLIHGCQRLGHIQIIAVQKGDVFAISMSKAGVSGTACGLVRIMPVKADFSIATVELSAKLIAAVCRTVIYDDNFKVMKGLLQHAVYSFRDI